jgi:Fe-S oxidoreductase
MVKQKRCDVNSMTDLIHVETERILSACTRCGRCFEVCPVTSYAGLPPETSGEAVVADVLNILRGDAGSPQALSWAQACLGSGECVQACPESVNPKMMVRIARMIAAGGTGGEVQIKMIDDPDHFPRMRAYAQMQFTEDEVSELL